MAGWFMRNQPTLSGLAHHHKAIHRKQIKPVLSKSLSAHLNEANRRQHISTYESTEGSDDQPADDLESEEHHRSHSGYFGGSIGGNPALTRSSGSAFTA